MPMKALNQGLRCSVALHSATLFFHLITVQTVRRAPATRWWSTASLIIASDLTHQYRIKKSSAASFASSARSSRSPSPFSIADPITTWPTFSQSSPVCCLTTSPACLRSSASKTMLPAFFCFPPETQGFFAIFTSRRKVVLKQKRCDCVSLS